jgi:tetratricopeptide (TPR) repeat protein
MTQAIDRLNVSDVNDDEPNAPEEYLALLRALRRKRGFGLFFVQASPAKGQEILSDLRRDLPGKQVIEAVLNPQDNRLFEQLEAIEELVEVDIFWIEGLEQSLLSYEDMQRLVGWDTQDLITYSWKDVPPILSHLNLGRERFESQFSCALVFIVPLFVVKYLLQRAGDFFDWKSGFFEFPNDRQESVNQMIEDADYNVYLRLDRAERTQKILQIKDLLDMPDITTKVQAKLLHEIGRLFASGKDYEQAITYYERAIQIRPTLMGIWDNKGVALQKIGRYDQAIVAYEQAIALSSRHANAYKHLGHAYKDQGNYTAAIEAYQAAVELRPKDASLYVNLGHAYRNQKNYAAAITAYQAAVELRPKDASLYVCLGNTQKAQKSYVEAIANYQAAIELCPNNIFAIKKRGQVHLQLNQAEKAVQDFDHVIELSPRDKLVYYLRALAHLKLNQPKPAETDFQKAIAISTSKYEEDPIDYQNNFNLALYHLAAAHPEESDRLYTSNLTAPIEWRPMAIDDLDDFLQLFPDHSQAQQVKQLLQRTIDAAQPTTLIIDAEGQPIGTYSEEHNGNRPSHQH